MGKFRIYTFYIIYVLYFYLIYNNLYGTYIYVVLQNLMV